MLSWQHIHGDKSNTNYFPIDPRHLNFYLPLIYCIAFYVAKFCDFMANDKNDIFGLNDINGFAILHDVEVMELLLASWAILQGE